MSRRTSYTYTGNNQWKEVITTDDIRVPRDSIDESKSKDSISNSGSSETDTQKEISSKFKKQEIFLLTGDLQLTTPNLDIKVGDTVLLEGLGTNLSGNYSVESIIFTISGDNGLSQSLRLSRSGFGKTLIKNGTPKPLPPSTPKTRKNIIEK